MAHEMRNKSDGSHGAGWYVWGRHADQIDDAKTKELNFEQEDLVK